MTANRTGFGTEPVSDSAPGSAALGWRGEPLCDLDGKVICNGTPPRYITNIWGRNGSLSWALSLISSASQEGGLSGKWSSVEAARRLYPWLIATGWTPPEGEPDIEALTQLLREAHGLV